MMGFKLMEGYADKLKYLQLLQKFKLPAGITGACSMESVESLVEKENAVLFLGACRFDVDELTALMADDRLYEFLVEYWSREDVSTEHVKILLHVIMEVGTDCLAGRKEQLQIVARWIPTMAKLYTRRSVIGGVLAAAVKMDALDDCSMEKLLHNLEKGQLTIEGDDLSAFFKVRFPVFLLGCDTNRLVKMVLENDALCDFLTVLTEDVKEPCDFGGLDGIKQIAKAVWSDDAKRYVVLREQFNEVWDCFLQEWELIGFMPELLRKVDGCRLEDGALAAICPECAGRLAEISGNDDVHRCLLYAAVAGKEKFLAFALAGLDGLLELSYSSLLFHVGFISNAIDLDEVVSEDALSLIPARGNVSNPMMRVLMQVKEPLSLQELRMVIRDLNDVNQMILYLQLKEKIGSDALARMQEVANELSSCIGRMRVGQKMLERLGAFLERSSFSSYFEEREKWIADLKGCTLMKAILLGAAENDLLMREVRTNDELEFALRCVDGGTCDATTVTLDYLKENFCSVQPDYLRMMEAQKLDPAVLDVYGRVLYELSVGSRMLDLFYALSLQRDGGRTTLAVLRAICEHRFEEVRYSKEVLDAEILKEVDEVVAFNWFQDYVLGEVHVSGGYDGLMAAVTQLPNYYRWDYDFLYNACVKSIWIGDERKPSKVGSLILTKARERNPLEFRDVTEEQLGAKERLVLVLIAKGMTEDFVSAATAVAKMLYVPLVYFGSEGKDLELFAPKCRLYGGRKNMKLPIYSDEEYGLYHNVIEVSPLDE